MSNPNLELLGSYGACILALEKDRDRIDLVLKTLRERVQELERREGIYPAVKPLPMKEPPEHFGE